MRSGDTLAAAARKIGVSASELRRYVKRSGVVERRNGRWRFKRDRRFRRIPLYSSGRRIVIIVRNIKSAGRVGEYMNAVKQFLATENIDLLAPFEGRFIVDASGKHHAFETRPNVLFRLDASDIEPFELVYAIIKPS